MAILCIAPACRQIVRDGNSKCEKHRNPKRKDITPKTNQKTRRNTNIYDSQRWRRLSIKQRTKHPFCAHCALDNIVQAANVADHIIEIEDNPKLAYVMSNLQSLCFSCHAIKTKKVEAKRKANQQTKPLLQDL